MPIYCKALLCTVFWFTNAASALAGQTLADVYALAVVNDPDIRVANANYNAGKEQKNIANGGLKPRVNAYYNYSRSDTDSTNEFPFRLDDNAAPLIISTDTSAVNTSNNWGASISQTLFDVTVWQQAKQGQALSETALYEHQHAQQQLIIRTSNAYINVLKAQNNVSVAAAQLSADKAQLEQAQTRFEVGAIAKTDLHQAQAAADLSTALLLSNKARLSNHQRSLSIIMGEEPQPLMTLANHFVAVPPTPADPDSWQSQASANNLTVKIAQSQRDSAKAAAKAASAGRLPTINATLAYDDQDAETDDDVFGSYNNTSKGANLSVSVNLPLYAGGALGARKRQAQALYNRGIEHYAGAVRRAKQQTLSAYNDVIIDISSITARKQALTSSKSAADSIEAGYEVGGNSIIDLLAAKRAYYSALRDYGNARLDYLLSSLELKQLAGTLNPSDVVELSQHLTHSSDL